MSTTVETNKVTFTGNGATVDFAFTFRVFAAADLEVYLDGTLKTLTTHYTVDIDPSVEGGTVTFLTAPAASVEVLIKRVLDFTQPSVIPTEGNFPEKTVENALDRATMLIVQLKEILSRVPQLAIDSAFSDLTLPEPSAGKVLGWNDGATDLENLTLEQTTVAYSGTISKGVDASKPASPSQGDIYFATDTNTWYKCITGGSWNAVMEPSKGAAVASSGTTNIFGTDGDFLHITGTTTITSFGTALKAGAMRVVVFDGALTLTHHATNLILPGAANITTAAGDTLIVRAETTTTFRIISYMKASGYPVTDTGGGVLGSFKNLKIVRDSATQVTVTADELILEDTSNNKVSIRSVSEAIAITTSGASGLDTGAEGADTWYYIWIIRKSSDGTVNGLLSASSSSPTMPSGYDQKALVGAVRNDGSSNFISFRQEGRKYNYLTWRTLSSGNLGASWVAIDTTAFVPAALSTYCCGGWYDGGSFGAFTNDNSVATGTTVAPNKWEGNSNVTPWMFDIITANTLYGISDNTNYIIYIEGFDINKLV